MSDRLAARRRRGGRYESVDHVRLRPVARARRLHGLWDALQGWWPARSGAGSAAYGPEFDDPQAAEGGCSRRRRKKQSVATLDLSTRARNRLREEGIETIDQLRKWAREENHWYLSTVPRLGVKTLNEIRLALASSEIAASSHTTCKSPGRPRNGRGGANRSK